MKFHILYDTLSETYSKMKRKTKSLNIRLDSSSKNTDVKNDSEEIIDSENKKLKFDKSLNKKPIGKICLLCYILNLVSK